MKLTKIHIFLILLLALVLCSTLGVCYNKEGFSNINNDKRIYDSYSKYNTQKNEDTVKNTNIDDKKWSNNMNPHYNPKYMDELNIGDDNDRSCMNTNKTKYSSYDRRDNTNVDSVSVFDSVAKGKMNGAMYNVKETIVKEDDKQDGISRNRIPKGQEDLYILKSEIVPPICPACPSVNCGNSSSNETKKCPPCPPCARCPEPSFECKKVPNYNSKGLMNQLPIPWADKL